MVKPGGAPLRPPSQRAAPLPALLLELESLGEGKERAEQETAVGEEPPGRGQMCSLPATWSLSGVSRLPSERPGHKRLSCGYKNSHTPGKIKYTPRCGLGGSGKCTSGFLKSQLFRPTLGVWRSRLGASVSLWSSHERIAPQCP